MSSPLSRDGSGVGRPVAATPQASVITPPDAESIPGRRERSKRERRRRIEAAAREIFSEKGYTAATTREIAERADVGAGTLFTYARDKRELLLMIVNDELDLITDTAFATLPRSAPFLNQLLHIFTPHYHFWARDLGLSRHVIHETVRFIETTDDKRRDVEALRFHARTRFVGEAIVKLIVTHQQSGNVGKHVKPIIGATLLVDIFLSEIRNWGNGENPDVRAALAHLRKVLGLAISGFKP